MARLTGKKVINAGGCGDDTGDGVNRIAGLLEEHQPATLMLLLGSNDLISGQTNESTNDHLRFIIRAAKANKTTVLLANLPPQTHRHSPFAEGVKALNPKINALARAEGVRLVNLAAEFGERFELLQEDGLHPSDAGTQVIAAAFAQGAGVQEDDRFSARLERMLNTQTNLPPARVDAEVQAGISTYQQTGLLTAALARKPDLVVLAICLNDTEDWTRAEELLGWRKAWWPSEPSAWLAWATRHCRWRPSQANRAETREPPGASTAPASGRRIAHRACA